MLDRDRFPVDDWRIVERGFRADDAGRGETVFSLGNGYLGLRGNHPDVAPAYEQGTFVNGFHETWPIRHAENAYGFAQVGQTIVNAPDAKPMQLVVDGEPLTLDGGAAAAADGEAGSAVGGYRRELDLRAGALRRTLVWRTRTGARLRVEFERIVSFADRHLAAQRLEVTVLAQGDGGGPLRVEIVSSLVNRQDARGEHDGDAAGESSDPRRVERVEGRVLIPEPQEFAADGLGLAYRTSSSGLGIAVAVAHEAEVAEGGVVREQRELAADLVTDRFTAELRAGERLALTKFAAYHDGDAAQLPALAAACDETLHRAAAAGFDGLLAAQRVWLDDFWRRSDVTVAAQPEVQQAVRWCLFQVAQSAARADGRGVAAKGVSGSGYSGHYFWDTEIYVLPFLSYTAPEQARNALRMRVDMLPAARRRAAQLSERGALFPWRTINGEEASAYYPAGTAQYHIDADICFAVAKYVRATGDLGFLAEGGIDIAVETARMWCGLGFWRGEGDTAAFHIHGVTGPDEYTAVVNDNLYTNTMASFNLAYAASALEELALADPAAHAAALARLDVDAAEPDAWRRAAAGMHIGFDETAGVHPQDAQFLEREVWDFAGTPSDKYPLLLHFHPLVIYRHQVLKQADAVLALFLRSEAFTAEQKLADFEYYDPLTTGDSTLSGVVQAIIAAEVGYAELALEHFTEAISVDLADLHRNAADGVHVASAGGVWSALVYGFAGLRDADGAFAFDPRLPEGWPELSFALAVRGSAVRVAVRQQSIAVSLEADRAGVEAFRFSVRGAAYEVAPGATIEVALDGQGPRLEGRPTRPGRTA